MESDSELEAFLDEALPASRMAALEARARDDAALRARLAELVGRRDAGLHSLGGVWRSHRLTCPSREQLGSFLLGVLAEDFADYVRFHVETIGCRCCSANLDDLRRLTEEPSAPAAEAPRRRKYFESSIGRLPGGKA